MEVAERSLRVMGSRAQVTVVGGRVEALADHAVGRLRSLEVAWTRFSESSELSRLNRMGGDEVAVGDDLMALVARSIDGWRLTGGRFDPTVLGSMQHIGYGSPAPDPVALVGPVGCGGIVVDHQHGTVRLPAGTGLDPGGIGKGLAADIIVEELLALDASGALVNVGGDLRISGAAPTIDGWTVAIEDPFAEEATIAMLSIADGGIATTTPDHRVWQGRDGRRRHIIDPRTGEPAVTDVASVTVLAGSAWMAEAVAKAAALAGSAGAIDVIDDAGLTGVVISEEGSIALSSRIGAFL